MPDRLRITYPVWVIYSFPILVEEQNDDFAAIAKGQAAFDDGSPPAQYLAVFMSAESAKDFAARHGLTTCSYKALAKDEFRPFLARAKKWGLDHVGFDADAGTGIVLPIEQFLPS